MPVAQECNQNASVLIYVLPMYFSHALIGLGDPKINEHRGRIVKTTGDGLLVEFPSVVDAVRCAVEIQREMALRNGVVPEERRIEFRFRINVGA